MWAVLFTWTYAIILVALAGEADTLGLQIAGYLAGGWMAIAGAIAGWQAARDE